MFLLKATNLHEGLQHLLIISYVLLIIGYGGISIHQIALKLAAQQEQPKEIAEVTPPRQPVSDVKVLGVGDMLTNLAQCCNPVPGDRIIGYITRSRGVTVHCQDCNNVINEDEKERLIPVEWGQPDSLYPVTVQVEAWDRVGLIRDITSVVAEEKVNIASMSFTNRDDHTTSLHLTLETRGIAQLSQLLRKMEGIRGMISVDRVGGEASIKTGAST